MAGTKLGGARAAKTNKEKYGEDFYIKLGSKGGKGTHPSRRPFAQNRELARMAGARGGRVSKRTKNE